MMIRPDAVVLATVVNQFIAMIYFGPLFGKTFMRLQMGSANAKPPANFDMTAALVRSVIGSFLFNLAIAYGLAGLKIQTDAQALFFGICLVLISGGTNLLHSGWESRSIEQVLLSEGFHFIAFASSAVFIRFYTVMV